MLRDTSKEIIASLVEKDYVLFARRSEHGLKVDYPELAAEVSFKGLGKYDLAFVWAFACASSPFLFIEKRNERIAASVTYAFPPHLREAKTAEMTQRMPDTLLRAIAKMEKYNLSARVEEYVLMQKARSNIRHIIAQDVTKADMDERKLYLQQVKEAEGILAGQRTRIEGSDLGVAMSSETLYSEAVDVASIYHSGQ